MEYPSLTILAELWKAGEAFKIETTDITAASYKYCETATQVLDRLEREGDSYEARVIGLWVALGYVSDLYPLLDSGPATTELCHKLFRQCARTVLNIKWQQLDDNKTCKKNFQDALQAFDNLMTGNGYTRFSLILSLNDSNWTHDVLNRVMSWDDDDEHTDKEREEAEQYIQGEDPVVLKLRVEMLLQENCEEFALSLCGWCLKHPALQDDLDIHQTQLMLLHRLSYSERLQEECQKISCHDGVRLIKRLQLTEGNGPLCTVLAQTFLIHDWIRISSVHCCTKDLLKLWIQHQSQVDQDEEKFLSSIWAVAKLSSSSELIGLLIESLRQERGDALAQLYTDLFRFGLNLDKQVLEKLDREADQDALNSQLTIISGTCRKLGEIYADIHTKTAKACYLTAFSLHPTQMLLHAVERCWNGHHVSIFPESEKQDLDNINDTTSRDQGIISIASLYEVERLLESLRPSFLSPESSWDLLRSVCEKYLFEKQALAKQRALESSTPSSEDTDLDSSSILETSSQDSQDSGELVEEMFDPTASPGSLSQQASAGEPSPLSSQNSPASLSSALPHGVFDSAMVVSSAASNTPATHGSTPSLPQKVMVQVSLPSTVANFQLPLSQLQSSQQNLPRLLPSSSSMAGLMINQQHMPSYSMAPSSGTNVTTATSTLEQGMADMSVGSGDGKASQGAVVSASSGMVGDDILRLAQETVAGLPAGSQVFIASTQVKQQLIIAVTPSSDGNLFLPESSGNMAYTPYVQVSNNPVGIFPSVPRFPSSSTNTRRPLMKTNTPIAVVRPPAATKVSTATVSKVPGQAVVSTVASSHLSTQLPGQDANSFLLVNPADPNACPLGASSTYPAYSDGNSVLGIGHEGSRGHQGNVMSLPQIEQGKFQKNSSIRSSDLGGSGAESSDDFQALHPGLKLEGGLYTEVVRSQPKKKKKKKPVVKQDWVPSVELVSPGMSQAPKGTIVLPGSSSSPGPANRNLPIYCGAVSLPLPPQSQGLASISPPASGKPTSDELNGSQDGSSSPGAHSLQSTLDGNYTDELSRQPDGRYKRYNKTYFTTFYKCIICGTLHESFPLLRKHVKEACRAGSKRTSNAQYDMKQIIRGSRVIKCTTCNAMCDSDKDVKYHQEHCVALRIKKAKAEKQQETQTSPKKAVYATIPVVSTVTPEEAFSVGGPEKTEIKILPSTSTTGNPCPTKPSVILAINPSPISASPAPAPVSLQNPLPSLSGMNNQVLPVGQQILSGGTVQSAFPTTSADSGSSWPGVDPDWSKMLAMQTKTVQKSIPTAVQGHVQSSEALESGHVVAPAASSSQPLASGLPVLGTSSIPVAVPPTALNSNLSSRFVQSQNIVRPSTATTTALPQVKVVVSSTAPAPQEESNGGQVPMLPKPPSATTMQPQTDSPPSVSTDFITQAQSTSNGDLGTVNLEHASDLQLLCARGDIDMQSSLDGAGENQSQTMPDGKKKVRKKVTKKKKEDGKDMDAEGKGESTEGMNQKEKSQETTKQKKKSLPDPMYDVLKSSVGTCFYKCRLCFVSFSSQENFAEHWDACLQKNPPSSKRAAVRHHSSHRSKKDTIRKQSVGSSDSLHSNVSGSEEASSPGSSASGADGSRGSNEESNAEEGERGRGKKRRAAKQVCEQCSLVFNDQPSYIKHICSRHIKSYEFQNIGNRFKFTCIMCQGIYSTFFNMMNHVVSHADLVMKTFSEKIADGTVQDYDPRKHARLLHKAKLKAERNKQRKVEQHQVANGPDRKRRFSVDSENNRASSRSRRSSASRRSSESNKEDQPSSTTSLEDCKNKCITRDLRIMLSDINYPGSEFSKEIESYNAANHTDQVKAKEKQESSEEEHPEEQSEEEVQDSEVKDNDQDEVRVSDAEPEPVEGMEVDDENKVELANMHESAASDDISLLSLLSNDSDAQDSIALDYQAGNGPSLSEMQEQAARAPLVESEDAHSLLPGVPDDEEKKDDACVSEQSEIVEDLLAEMVTKVALQQLSEETEGPSELGGDACLLEMEPQEESQARGRQDSPLEAETDNLNAGDEEACHYSVALVLEEMVSQVCNMCESDVDVDLLPQEAMSCDSGNAQGDLRQADSCIGTIPSNTTPQDEPNESDIESSDSGESVNKNDCNEDALPIQSMSETSLPSGSNIVSSSNLTPEATNLDTVQDMEVDMEAEQSGFSSKTAELKEEAERLVETQDQESQDVAVSEEKCINTEEQMAVDTECQKEEMTESAMECSSLADTEELEVSEGQVPMFENADEDKEAKCSSVNSHDASKEPDISLMMSDATAVSASTQQSANVHSTATNAASEVKDKVPTEQVINIDDPSSHSDAGVKACSSLQLLDSIKKEVKEEVEEVSAPSQPPKRGRGRPRKRPLDSDSSSSERLQTLAAKVPKVEVVDEDEDGRSTPSMKTRLKKATQGQVLNQMYYNALRDATCMTKTPKAPTDPCLRDSSLTSPKRAKRESPLRRPTISTRSKRSGLFPRRSSPYKEMHAGRASRQSKAVTTKRLSSQSPPGSYPREPASWNSFSPRRSTSERSSKLESKPVVTSPARPRGRPPLRPPTAAVTPVGRISSSVGAVTSPRSGRAARTGDHQRGTSAPTPCTRASRSRSNSGAVGARVPLRQPNLHDTTRGQQESFSQRPTDVALPVPRVTTPQTASEIPTASTSHPKDSGSASQGQPSSESSPPVSSVERKPDAEKTAPDDASPSSYQGSYVNFLSTCGLNPDHKKILDAQRSPVSEAKLEGVKVLRDSIKKKPFSWDVEEEDSASKKAEKDKQNLEKNSKKTEEKDSEIRNEEHSEKKEKRDSEAEKDDCQIVEETEDRVKTEKEPIKKLREKLSVAPFTWDLDESEDNQSPPRKRRRRSIRNRTDSNSQERDDMKDAATSIECEGVLQSVMLKVGPSLELVVMDNGSGEGVKDVAMETDADNPNTTNTDKTTTSGNKSDQKAPQTENPAATCIEGKPDEVSFEVGQPSGRFGRGRMLRSRTQMVHNSAAMPAVVRKSGAGPGRGRNSYDGNLGPTIQVYRVQPITHEMEAKPRNSRVSPGDLSARTVHTPVPIEDMKKVASSKTASQSEGGSDTKNWTIAKKSKTNYPYSFTRARGQKK